jgi:hypothetical protein
VKHDPRDWLPEVVLILLLLGVAFWGTFYAFLHQ